MLWCCAIILRIPKLNTGEGGFPIQTVVAVVYTPSLGAGIFQSGKTMELALLTLQVVLQRPLWLISHQTGIGFIGPQIAANRLPRSSDCSQ